MEDTGEAIIAAIRSGARSMREILAWLERAGNPLSQPTVSRQLSVLIARQRVRRIGQGRSTSYEYDDYHDYFAVPGDQRKAVGYDPSFIDRYEPNATGWFSTADLRRMREAGQGRELRDAGTYSRAIAQKLLVDLSYASSRLEGNTYSYLDTEVLVQYGKAAAGKDAVETQMILNHKEAINYLVANIDDIVVDVREVKTMHSMLSVGLVDAREIGSVRQRVVTVGNSAYKPLSIPARLDDELSRIVSKAVEIEDPFEQSLFLMVTISYLQYFVDVNKRTGRLMANVPLLKAGMAPLSFLNVDKTEYTRGLLSFYELGRTDVIAAAYRDGYVASASRYDAYVGRDMSVIEMEARYRGEIHRLTRDYVLGSLERGERLGDDFLEEGSLAVEAGERDAFLAIVRGNVEGLHDGNHRAFGITRQQYDEYALLPVPGDTPKP